MISPLRLIRSFFRLLGQLRKCLAGIRSLLLQVLGKADVLHALGAEEEIVHGSAGGLEQRGHTAHRVARNGRQRQQGFGAPSSKLHQRTGKRLDALLRAGGTQDGADFLHLLAHGIIALGTRLRQRGIEACNQLLPVTQQVVVLGVGHFHCVALCLLHFSENVLNVLLGRIQQGFEQAEAAGVDRLTQQRRLRFLVILRQLVSHLRDDFPHQVSWRAGLLVIEIHAENSLGAFVLVAVRRSQVLNQVHVGRTGWRPRDVQLAEHRHRSAYVFHLNAVAAYYRGGPLHGLRNTFHART